MGEAYQRDENRITESTQNMNDLKSAPLAPEVGMTEILVDSLPEYPSILGRDGLRCSRQFVYNVRGYRSLFFRF
jgi:hypothetical protein